MIHTDAIQAIIRAADPSDQEDLNLRAQIARALALDSLTRHPNRQHEAWKCYRASMLETTQ